MIDSYAHPMTWPRRSLLKVRARRVGNLVLSRLKRPPHENLAVLLVLAGMRPHKQRGSEDNDTQLPPELRKRSWLLEDETESAAASAGDPACNRAGALALPANVLRRRRRIPEGAPSRSAFPDRSQTRVGANCSRN